MDTPLTYTYSAATHSGDRITNQDNLSLCGDMPFSSEDESYCRYNTDSDILPAVFGLCDGIGTLENSEDSARVTLETLVSNSATLPTEENKISWIHNTVDDIKSQVNKYLIENEKKGGNTLSFLILDENRFFFANIGDSPAFLLKKGKNALLELSVRHNLANYHRLVGKPVSPEDSRCLIYSVGANPLKLSEIVNISADEVSSGDCFLLCSDGITNELSEAEIISLLQRKASAAEFVEKAAIQPGADNCTAIVIYTI